MAKEKYIGLEIIDRRIQLYCIDKHHENTLCAECLKLLQYSRQRIYNCPYKNAKVLLIRPVHCYSPRLRRE